MNEFEALALAAAAKKKRDATVAEKSLGQSFMENLIGDNDPTTQNTGEKIGSFLNKAGESLSFGLVGDETSAAVESLIPGVDYEGRLNHYRGQEEVMERENPGLALGADVGGAVAGMALPFGMIGTLGRGAGIIPRVAASAGAGAVGGAVHGFTEGEGLEGRIGQAASGGAVGGAVGAAVPVVGAGVQRIADAVKGRGAIRAAAANAPTSDQLRQLGSRLYDQVDDAGVQVSAPAFDDARSKIVQALRSNTAYTPRPGGRTITPNTSAVVDNMADMADEMAGHQGRPCRSRRLIACAGRQALRLAMWLTSQINRPVCRL